jgi:hypothetical protein
VRARWLYLSLALLIGCTEALIVYERDGGDVGRDASVDAASDVGVEIDAGPPDAGDPCRGTQDLVGMPDGCTLVRPPPRPICDETGDVPPFEVGFLMPDFRAAVGFDLDGYCTVLDGVSSCSNAMGTIPDSTSAGTDNAFGLIIMEGLRAIAPSIEGEFAGSARERGVGVPMVRIEDWNGLADDEQVMVTFAVGAELEGADSPDWSAGDVEVNPANGFFTAGGAPLARDLTAYVADGKLVAVIPESLPFDFAAEGRRLSIALRDARLVIGLTPEGPTDFTVYGRWSVAEATAAVELLAPCPADVTIRTVAANLLNRAADVRSDRTEDGAGLVCNSVSLAIRFSEAHPIRWGTPVPIDLDPMCM